VNTVGLLEREMEMSATLWKTKILVALTFVCCFFLILTKVSREAKIGENSHCQGRSVFFFPSDFVAICTLSMWGLDRVINVTSNVTNINLKRQTVRITYRTPPMA